MKKSKLIFFALRINFEKVFCISVPINSDQWKRTDFKQSGLPMKWTKLKKKVYQCLQEHWRKYCDYFIDVSLKMFSTMASMAFEQNSSFYTTAMGSSTLDGFSGKNFYLGIYFFYWIYLINYFIYLFCYWIYLFYYFIYLFNI